MKNTYKLALATLVFTAVPASAAQYVFVSGNNSAETKICIAAAKGNVHRYKISAKSLSNRANVQQLIANKLTCNEQHIAEFARQYGAVKTANYISRYAKHGIIIKREISEVSGVSKPIASIDNEIIYVTVN